MGIREKWGEKMGEKYGGKKKRGDEVVAGGEGYGRRENEWVKKRGERREERGERREERGERKK